MSPAVGVGLDLISLAEGCPAAPTGRTYVGLHDDVATDTLTAILYADGVGQSVIAQKSYAGLFGSVSEGHVRRDHDFGGGDRLVFLAGGLPAGPRERIVTWDLDANTFAVLDWGSTLDFVMVLFGLVYASEAATWTGTGGDYTGVQMMEGAVGVTDPLNFPAILRCGYIDTAPSGVFTAMGGILGDWAAGFHELYDPDGSRRLGLYNDVDGDPHFGPVLPSVSALGYPYHPIHGTPFAASWGALTASGLYAMTMTDVDGDERVITTSPWHSVLSGHGPVESSPDGSELTSLVSHAGQLSILRFATPAWADLPMSAQAGCPPPTIPISPYLGLTPSAMVPRD